MAYNKWGLYGPAAPSGFWQPCEMITQGTGTPASGVVYFQQIDIGPTPRSIKALGCQLVTAMSGGAATVTLGLYPDNGTGGLPDCSKLLASGAIADVTTVGIKSVPISPVLVFPPGRAWLASLYVVTTAPTTSAIFNTVSAARFWCTPASGTNIGSSSRGPQITGPSTVLPTTTQPATAFTANTANNVSLIVAVQTN